MVNKQGVKIGLLKFFDLNNLTNVKFLSNHVIKNSYPFKYS